MADEPKRDRNHRNIQRLNQIFIAMVIEYKILKAKIHNKMMKMILNQIKYQIMMTHQVIMAQRLEKHKIRKMQTK